MKKRFRRVLGFNAYKGVYEESPSIYEKYHGIPMRRMSNEEYSEWLNVDLENNNDMYIAVGVGQHNTTIYQKRSDMSLVFKDRGNEAVKRFRRPRG